MPFLKQVLVCLLGFAQYTGHFLVSGTWFVFLLPCLFAEIATCCRRTRLRFVAFFAALMQHLDLSEVYFFEMWPYCQHLKHLVGLITSRTRTLDQFTRIVCFSAVLSACLHRSPLLILGRPLLLGRCYDRSQVLSSLLGRLRPVWVCLGV